MASSTISRKPGCKVVRVLRGLEIDPMTSNAIRGYTGILMLRRAGVACLTFDCSVSPEEREPRLLMLLHHIDNLP
jgi:hypothetical protein